MAEAKPPTGTFVGRGQLDEAVTDILQIIYGIKYKDVTLFPKFDTKNENVKINKWLDWAENEKRLKITTTPIPAGILPHDWTGNLIDVKVFCRHKPDDEVYDSCQELRDKVARGNCFLRVSVGSVTYSSCVIYALKKFTGGLGDDDDRDKGDNFTWQKYFKKPIDEAVTVVTTRKANGEAAHFSCRSINGEFILIAGSKNVHIMIKTRADIAVYQGDRYHYAGEVCHSVMDMLDNMEESQKHRLLVFLSKTRLTAIFEMLSAEHQHVEDFSHFKRRRLQFITWVSSDVEPPTADSLCALQPDVAIEVAKRLGLQTVDYDVMPVAQVQNRMNEIRQGYRYEGEVLYFQDSSGSVIGLLKKKTIWYILCRAIREKVRGASQMSVKNPDRFSISAAIIKIEKRIDEIQTWLGLDMQSVQAWKLLGSGFLRWTLHQLDTGDTTLDDASNKFPVLWSRYLEESGNTDKITYTCQETSTHHR